MDEKLQEIEQRFDRLTADLGDPAVLADPARFRETAKERAQLEPPEPTENATQPEATDEVMETAE